MNLSKLLLFLLILPLTLFLDLILYAFVRSCPACGGFWEWVRSEGALSFPLVVSLTEWFEQILQEFKISTRN